MMEPGLIYFFTATNLEWNHLLKNDQHKLIITNSLRFLVRKNKIRVYAFVIMPNHIHLVWSVYGNPIKVQQSFMKYIAQSIIEHMRINCDPLLKRIYVGAADRELQFWERNPLAVELYTPEVMWQKIDYIHNNPAQPKWNLAPSPEDYRWSSAAYYILNRDDWGFITHIDEA